MGEMALLCERHVDRCDNRLPFALVSISMISTFDFQKLITSYIRMFSKSGQIRSTQESERKEVVVQKTHGRIVQSLSDWEHSYIQSLSKSTVLRIYRLGNRQTRLMPWDSQRSVIPMQATLSMTHVAERREGPQSMKVLYRMSWVPAVGGPGKPPVSIRLPTRYAFTIIRRSYLLGTVPAPSQTWES